METASMRLSSRGKTTNTVASFLLKTYEILEVSGGPYCRIQSSPISSAGPPTASASPFSTFNSSRRKYCRGTSATATSPPLSGRYSSLLPSLTCTTFTRSSRTSTASLSAMSCSPAAARTPLLNDRKELKNIKRKAPRNPRPVPGDSSVQQRATPSSKNSHQPTSKQSA